MSELAALLEVERAARHDAERLNRLKDEFLSALSHELRAPLTNLLLWEKVLRDEATTDEVRRQALDAIHESALAQSRLIGDLVDVSRALGGKLRVERRLVDLSDVLAGALDDARDVADTKQVGIDADGDANILLEADAVRLRQAFEKVLAFLLDLSDPGDRIAVAIKRVDGVAKLVFTNQSRAIAPELLPHLFDPFGQAGAALASARGGLELGIVIAHHVVALHEGSLSASAGQGATLTMTLPAARSRQAASPPVAGARTALLAGVRVLVVDDDDNVRRALGLLLKRTGALVEVADGADSARARLVDECIDVIICDISMPGEDGYTFIKKLRDSGYRAPAIAVTAHASSNDASRARDAGFDLHVAKPVNFERLVTGISQLVTAHRV